MNSPDSSSYSPTVLQPGRALSFVSLSHWQEIRFYEQRIINLELLLNEINQRSQRVDTLGWVDRSVQARYDSLEYRYQTQLKQAYCIRERLLVRLTQDGLLGKIYGNNIASLPPLLNNP